MSDSEDEVEYELESFKLGEFQISVTTVAYLPITKLLANQSKSVEISGQKLWCGSLCLINHLFANRSTVENSHFIELGAGTGVVSMLAIKLGAKSAIATDHDQISLDHMKQDFALNSVGASIERLDWYQPNVAPITASLGTCAGESVCIIAGDVLYKHVLLTPFFDTVTTLLAEYPHATLVLCHVPRAGVEQSEVVGAAEARGLKVTEISGWTMCKQLAEYCPEEDLARARIYCIERQ